VHGLSSAFNLYPSPWHLIKEILFRGKHCHDERWALRDVSIQRAARRDRRRGRRQRRRQSTLLKILAGVLDKTTATSIFAATFAPSSSSAPAFRTSTPASKTIYIGAATAWGYSRQEINECLEWIIDFSGLRDAIGQAVRTYSSGMKARLTFAVTFCRQRRNT